MKFLLKVPVQILVPVYNLKSWEERKHSVQEVMEELEEKSKEISGCHILNSSNLLPYLVMEQPVV